MKVIAVVSRMVLVLVITMFTACNTRRDLPRGPETDQPTGGSNTLDADNTMRADSLNRPDTTVRRDSVNL